MLKVTTIFVFVFFTFLVAPAYMMSAAPLSTTAGILLCGICPILYVTYSASPFVTAVHLHLPPFARTSAEMLRRFVANAPPATKLDIVSQSFIGKPRVSTITMGELKPCKKRWGMVNFERDTATANEERKWYHWRAIGKFNIQEGNEGKTKNGWVWPEIAKTTQKRNEAKP
ncbi:hypothetical protein B0T14DRAFT_490401 [Immersiella caudata]|uniref:Uncharacterized protein n=1 Tax=Immersiella caudata TaxID=314043 RepID=A0AA39XDH7_9PEZI|nr:hypothetical protein B0T14DRAFT_490401 [Immersiella caudata]